MIFRTPTLSEWPDRMVRLACDLCPRRGQYRKGTFIARFGGDVLMPDVRHLIAECPRKDVPGAACGVLATLEPLSLTGRLAILKLFRRVVYSNLERGWSRASRTTP
jgi:hypothetical protein